MPDEPDPPRKLYGVKPREDFERANGTTDQPGNGPTDVQGFIASANAADFATKANAPANRPNEVHAILQENLRRDIAAGLHPVSTAPDPRRIRRRRNFWIALTIVDVPFGLVAWAVGPGAAIPFVCAIGLMAMFTGVLIWRTWCFRTEA
jgi:hypothetical protein